ncbi:MAG: hypothetical protein EAY81_09590 [Bacteroidetes bacterium]|nr:MAG: hypothetical protein EAY81_09590 [Bacteroidota bacterium]
MKTLVQYAVPEWVSLVFLMAIPLPFILLLVFIRKEAKKLRKPLAFPLVLAFFVAYLSYLTLASFQGWFNQVSFPPMVLLLSTFPYAFLLFGVVLNTNINKQITANASVENLIRLHVFRLIGVFFILLTLHDALPSVFAWIAGVGDVITAISSVFVAKAIQQKKPYAKQLALCWNIFGTIDILFTAIAANVLTKISIDTGSMGVDALAAFPFCIIPAFAPPTILFIHWAIFKKLRTFST